jgi:hypothetical protein
MLQQSLLLNSSAVVASYSCQHIWPFFLPQDWT